MTKDIQDRRWVLRLAMPASVVLHVLVIALLVFGLPPIFSKPPKEQVTQVALVPPPKPPEKPPEKPKDKPPEKKTEPEKPKETKAEPPKPAPESPASPPAAQTLRPVVQYGGRDAGPRQSTQGSSAEEAANPEKQQKQEPPKPPPVVTSEGQAAVPPPQLSKPEPSKPHKALKPKEVKTLFSLSATGDPLATAAMANMPRPARAARLCATELDAQLAHASPPYFADLLPSYPLLQGNVMDVKRAAFRSAGVWLDLRFRCVVDDGATRVMSFAYSVGDPIPRGDWDRRGLPAQ